MCYYATHMQGEPPELDAALRERFVQVVAHLDEAVASYERLGFEQVPGWAGEGAGTPARSRSGVTRRCGAQPALVSELGDRPARKRRRATSGESGEHAQGGGRNRGRQWASSWSSSFGWVDSRATSRPG